MKRTAATAFLLLTASSASPLTSQTDPGRAAFVEWARGALAPLTTVAPGPDWADLDALGRMVGDAAVVALSEGVHAGAEPLEFRNRVFQYLVEEKGFTAIAIESGIVEGRRVHDYVRTGDGDLERVLAEGISWTFDQLPQNETLVRWLREYNADPGHGRQLDFYGFDVPGSPGNPIANRGLDTALREALDYLASVDGPASAALLKRVQPLMPRIQFDQRPTAAPGYATLTQVERDALTATIVDLITLLERREAVYTGSSSATEYAWGFQAAVGALQADRWLREMPVGWEPSSGPSDFFSRAVDVRDRAQADNLDWIVRQEGDSGKILVFASRYHLSTTPIARGGSLDGTGQEVAGTYLRRRLGDRLLTIGNLIGGGTIGCAGFTMNIEEATPASIDGLAGELKVPLFLLDLRTAPAAVASWLDHGHRLGEGSGALGVQLGRAFDVLFYLDAVTPACPE